MSGVLRFIGGLTTTILFLAGWGSGAHAAPGDGSGTGSGGQQGGVLVAGVTYSTSGGGGGGGSCSWRNVDGAVSVPSMGIEGEWPAWSMV